MTEEQKKQLAGLAFDCARAVLEGHDTIAVSQNDPKRVLHLTLKRRWFDMIASGTKREEYREMKPYWNKRLSGQRFDAVHFRNGYSADAPAMLVELRDIGSGLGVIAWGAPAAQPVYVLRLGAILKAPNVGAKRAPTAGEIDPERAAASCLRGSDLSD